MNILKKSIITLAAILGVSAMAVAPVHAALELDTGGLCSQMDDVQKAAAGCNEKGKTVVDPVINIITAVIGVVGILAVLVIVVAGQRLVSSNGDPGKVKQAKDMILYAVVAVIVAVMAFAITTFVSGAITSDQNTKNPVSSPSGP